MAEIDLVSSHHPWAPLPRLVPWDEVGDGSVFDGMPEQGEPSDVVFRRPRRGARGVRRVDRVLAGRADRPSSRPTPTRTWCSSCWATTSRTTYVTGEDAGHDVPISVIAQDPAVMDRIAGWGWQDGPASRARTPRSGRWTASGTGSSRRSAPGLRAEVDGAVCGLYVEQPLRSVRPTI